MTPREMAADELESILAAMRRIGMRVEAETLRAHIAALRARAEAAEADNAALSDALTTARTELGKAQANIGWGTPARLACGRAYDAVGRILSALRPGTGYRAKVRAELLRELANEFRDAAAKTESDARAGWYGAAATRLAAQAAREEQG